MIISGHLVAVELRFEPRALWVGASWERWPCALEVSACVLPTLPLTVYWQWPPRPAWPRAKGA